MEFSIQIISCYNLLFLFLFSSCNQENNEINSQFSRPNILLILADDMGYSDIGCYGGELETPNIDQLAANGVKFTQFYNGARCCPTRASLLTGLYAHQTGIGHMVDSRSRGPGYLGELNKQCVSIAQVLKTAGYQNYMLGKWHISKSTSDTAIYNWPIQRGFDRYYGTITGAGSFYDPATLVNDNQPIRSADEYYYTDAISDSASVFLGRHLEQNSNPFFMYVSYTAPHWPLHAPEKDIEKYQGAFAPGWDSLRIARLNHMKVLGVISEDMEISPRDDRIPEWSTVTDKFREQRKMEVYAAQISKMDAGIGKIVGILEAHQALENTLIIFLSDNGGCAEEFNMRTEWVQRYGPKLTRSGEEVIYGNDSDLLPGGDNTYQSYGLNWANLSNTPFRYYKHYVHEGGISTPLIIQWSKHIKEENRIIRFPAHLIDIMPTLVEVAGAEYPEVFKQQAIHPMEGISLIPQLNQDMDYRESALFWEHEQNRAVRKGKWKLVSKRDEDWELYDIDKDRSELLDLAQVYPAIVNQLSEEWESWAWRCAVFPLPE